MKDVYLHIGGGLSGTSYVQNILYPHREMLLKHGYCYPYDLLPNNISGGDNQKILAFISKGGAYKKAFMRPYAVDSSGNFEEFKILVREHFRKQTMQLPNNTKVILSAEQLWSELVDYTDLMRLKENLLASGMKVKRILFYVREQAEWLNAFYLQKAYEGRKTDFSLPFGYKSLFQRLDYFQTAMLWERVFDDAEIKIRIYRREYFSLQKFLDDLLDSHEQAVELSCAFGPQASATENSGLPDLNTFKAILYWNRAIEHSTPLSRLSLPGKAFEKKITNLRKMDKNSDLYIQRDQAKDIRSIFEGSNSLLTQKYLKNGENFSMSSLHNFPEGMLKQFSEVDFLEFLFFSNET